MIYTITISPAIDYVVHLDVLENGMTNRSSGEEYFFGGKGINVSQVLKQLGEKSVALGFVSGFTGQALEKGLNNMGINTDFIHSENGITRINVKIKAEEETEVNGQGTIASEADIEALAEKLKCLEDDDTVVLSGNVPTAFPQDIYNRILEQVKDKNINIIVDTTGELLLNTLKYRPFLIKPNIDELKQIFGNQITAEDGAEKLRSLGARNVIVSMGKDGALLSAEDGNVYRAGVCPGEVLNTVGAGDSMVAGFLSGYMKTKDYQYALDLGSAAGTATALSPGLAEKEKNIRLLKRVEEGEVIMRITNLLNKDAIMLNADVSGKNAAIDALIDMHDKVGNLSDKESYRQGILARENESTTAVGEGIAIPHAKSAAVAKAGLAVMTVKDGVDYGAPDGKPSNLLFMIAAPEDGDLHLEVLSRLVTLLMDLEIRKKLVQAKSADEFLNIIDMAEEAKYGKSMEKTEMKEKTYKIVAVTACPTGIAHTYMAAEALEQKAKEMGVEIKVETNGSGGAKNVLTPQEIQEADAVIIAADKNVEMVRFDGKPVVTSKVSKGINEPEALINTAISGNAPVYTYEGGKTTESNVSDESAGHQIYKHLMNGVSYMLPFVIGGGIMIALAFLIDTIAGAPKDSGFGSYTEAAAFFKTIGGYAFSFMLPVLAGYIARSIADRPGLAVGFVGGFIATLGCTFNAVGGDASAVSGFLGALIAGFAGGYIVLLIKKLFAFLPKAVESMLPVLILPLLGIIVMGLFMCAINPAVGALNMWITDALNSMGEASKIILGCVVGGMMAIDMGGPFNKAAYVFGTAALTTGGFDIMAAVMIGGMVPPIAIALCATFFKNRWTETELKSAPVNYIMGLCFITEGAIPYAAADPIRVIPSCVAGSAVAGGLSMLFNCTLRAPHGGVFVFPVIGNVGFYVIALVAGAVVGMALLAILKKKVAK